MTLGIYVQECNCVYKYYSMIIVMFAVVWRMVVVAPSGEHVSWNSFTR